MGPQSPSLGRGRVAPLLPPPPQFNDSTTNAFIFYHGVEIVSNNMFVVCGIMSGFRLETGIVEGGHQKYCSCRVDKTKAILGWNAPTKVD